MTYIPDDGWSSDDCYVVWMLGVIIKLFAANEQVKLAYISVGMS